MCSIVVSTTYDNYIFGFSFLYKEVLKQVRTGRSTQISFAKMPSFLCIICEDGINGETDVCSLPCGHVYHNECIKNWCNKRKTCPICAKKIRPIHDFRKLYFSKEPVKLELEPIVIELDEDEEDNSAAEIETLKDELAKSQASNGIFQKHIDELDESNRRLQHQVQDLEVRIRETLKMNHDLSAELGISEDKSRDFFKRFYICRAKICNLEATNRESEIRINQQTTDLDKCRKEKMQEISCLENVLNAAQAEHEAEREKWKKESEQIQKERLEAIRELQKLKTLQRKKNADLEHRLSQILQVLNEDNASVVECEMGTLMNKENYDQGTLEDKTDEKRRKTYNESKHFRKVWKLENKILRESNVYNGSIAAELSCQNEDSPVKLMQQQFQQKKILPQAVEEDEIRVLTQEMEPEKKVAKIHKKNTKAQQISFSFIVL